MSDLRPSENQDQPLQLNEMRRRGFFDDAPNGDERLCKSHQPEEPGYLCTRPAGHDGPHAWVARGIEWPAADEKTDAQHIVAAIDRLTEQLRPSNLIAWQLGTAENYEREIRKGLDL